MSFHQDYEGWLHLADPQHCPVCRQAPMPPGMEDIVELPHSWLSAEPVDCLKGACHLIAKEHAVELFDFQPGELLALMQEVQLCAQALKTVTQAVKINYEIHGNTIPHFHVHLYPRYLDDPFPAGPIDFSRKQRWFTPAAYQDFVNHMRAEIAAQRRD